MKSAGNNLAAATETVDDLPKKANSAQFHPPTEVKHPESVGSASFGNPPAPNQYSNFMP